MKTIKILLLIVSLLIFASSSNALIVSYGRFQNNQSTITINNGDNIYFDYALQTYNPPMNYNVKMYDNHLSLIKTFIDSSSYDTFVSGRYYITKDNYVKEGIYTIKIFGVDHEPDSDLSILTLIVNPKVNHAPILVPVNTQTINEGDLLRFNVYSSDPDNDHVTLTAQNLPNGAIFQDNNDNTGTFTWQTNYNDQGTYNVNLIASDGSLNSKETAMIIVNNVQVNHNPVIKILQPKENEVIFGTYNIKWNAVDEDQSKESLNIKLEYRQETNNIFKNIVRIFSDDWIVLEDGHSNNDGSFTWDTTKVSNGNYDLRATVKDNTGLIDQDLVSLFTINNIIISINHNPIITSSPITTGFVNKNYEYDVNAVDQDNDHLTYKLINYPLGMNIDKETGLITWMPNTKGAYDAEVMVEDGKGGSDTQSFSILVSEENPVTNPTIINHNFHNIKINNVILNYNGNLNIYTYLKNEGNKDERINLRAIIMQNGVKEITALNLDRNENKYGILSFDNLKKGYYIVKVEAFNDNNYEVKYAYITL